MSSASCLYEGSILHFRREPRRQFRHPLALAYVDLEELPALLDGRLVRPSPELVRFRRRDYLGDPRTALDHAVRELVERQTGRRPRGPVRVLTQLRSFGHWPLAGMCENSNARFGHVPSGPRVAVFTLCVTGSGGVASSGRRGGGCDRVRVRLALVR